MLYFTYSTHGNALTNTNNCFRLILIAEKDKVYEEFPTPLINRLEKHFVVTSTVLTEVQKELLRDLEAWANDYASIRLVAVLLQVCI